MIITALLQAVTDYTSTWLQLELSLDKIVSSVEKTAVDGEHSELAVEFELSLVVLLVSLSRDIHVKH